MGNGESEIPTRNLVMNLLIASMTGHGKSFMAQYKTEKNLPTVDVFVALDYDDEYRGLVETFPDVKWHPVGPKEIGRTPEGWATVFERNPKLVMPRFRLDDTEWSEVIGRIAQGLRVFRENPANESKKILILIDEAHAVAPQRKDFPKPITNLAVDGRSELMSVIWVTQRRSMIDKDIASQCTARYYGAFGDRNDLMSLNVDYPVEIHNPTASFIPNLPDSLKSESGESIPVRQFRNENGDLIGSEWIYSDSSGEMRRESTKGVTMKSKHYGNQGYRLEL